MLLLIPVVGIDDCQELAAKKIYEGCQMRLKCSERESVCAESNCKAAPAKALAALMPMDTAVVRA